MKIYLKEVPEGKSRLSLPIGISITDKINIKAEKAGLADFFLDYNKKVLFGKCTIKMDILLECARCLEIFTYHLSAEFNFMAGDVLKRVNKGIPEENILPFDKQGLELYIGGLLSEELALNIPMKPLCSQDCKGICSNCGADLNKISCKCAQKTNDPRWDELRKLKLRSK